MPVYLARMSDGVVFVARVGLTTVDATIALHKRFWEDHTRILGTVLNDWNPKGCDSTDITVRPPAIRLISIATAAE